MYVWFYELFSLENSSTLNQNGFLLRIKITRLYYLLWLKIILIGIIFPTILIKEKSCLTTYTTFKLISEIPSPN